MAVPGLPPRFPTCFRPAACWKKGFESSGASCRALKTPGERRGRSPRENVGNRWGGFLRGGFLSSWRGTTHLARTEICPIHGEPGHHEQISITGNPDMVGSFLAESADDDMVDSDSVTKKDGNFGRGNPTIIYDGGLVTDDFVLKYDDKAETTTTVTLVYKRRVR